VSVNESVYKTGLLYPRYSPIDILLYKRIWPIMLADARDNNDANRREALIYVIIENGVKDERERTIRLDEQARNLVGSILVVVGFLLATGTTSLVNVGTFFSILYFAGIITLVISILIVYIAFRYKSRMVINVDTLVDKYADASFETLRKRLGRTMISMLHRNNDLNRQKTNLISLSWLLMIVGLVMVTAFILTSIIWPQDEPPGNNNATAKVMSATRPINRDTMMSTTEYTLPCKNNACHPLLDFIFRDHAAVKASSDVSSLYFSVI
jgi:hypothetical protein